MTKDRWNEGYDSGFQQGKLAVYQDLLKIKYARWSVHSFNNEEYKPDEIYMTDYLIEEIWKAIDKMMIKYCDSTGESLFGDHRFIEEIDYKNDVMKFYTGS